MSIDRRDLLRLLAAVPPAVAAGCAGRGPAAPPSPAVAHAESALMTPPAGPPLQIVLVGYQAMTALDLVGPQLFLASLLGVEVRLVARDRAPLVTDTGLVLVPDASFADVPDRVDVLFVPGGAEGTLAAMRDPETVAFVAARGASATWITSVCTGALVLGQAGLLRGYRATTHWIAHGLLERAGATAVDARVVVDRNRVTGAGVSAGLDLGLQLAILLRGEAYARAVALNAEYAPAPPLRAGTPSEAGAEASDMLRAMYQPFVAAAGATLASAR